MKVLVIGSGGREHALLWKLSQSKAVTDLYVIPGNDGMSGLASAIPVTTDEDILDFASLMEVDLTVAGPETVLTRGLADRFEEKGLAFFGPSLAAARIEGSKRFAKELMKTYHIPTAAYETFDDEKQALAYLKKQTCPIVIKADGLASGKGVVIAKNQKEAEAAVHSMMEGRAFGTAGQTVVIEEYMEGEEVSVLAFCDGQTVIPMISSQDHKRIGDGDTGPNTGGMGAYAPAPVLTPDLAKTVTEKILRPAIDALKGEGCPFKGCLYAGLMITAEGPKVVEFNCRFGDPETEVVLPLLEGDLAEIMMHCVKGTLKEAKIAWKEESAVCVVMAGSGYPYVPAGGDVITGIEDAQEDGCIVFHAGTKKEDGQYVTHGGRVLDVVATAPTLQEACDKAYQGVARIHWNGAQYRHDIARKGLAHLKK